MRLLVLFLLCLPALLPAQRNLQLLYEKAAEQQQAKQWGPLSGSLRALIQRMPHSAHLHYRLGLAYAQLKRHEEKALDALNICGRLQGGYPIDSDSSFARLWGQPAFATIAKRHRQNMRPVGKEILGFELSDPKLIPEGIAYDGRANLFYISSIARRKIVACTPDGSMRDFIPTARDGIWEVLGLHVDEERRLLWACANASKQDGELDGTGGLWVYDLNNATLRKRFILPVDSNTRHLLNDVALARDGRAFITDMDAGVVYLADPKADTLRLFIRPGKLIFPNGIALSDDQQHLFIADAEGVWHYEFATKQLLRVQHNDNISLAGIDGLIYHAGVLIAVQNVVRPNRVVQILLKPDGSTAVGIELLQNNLPGMAIPTTGVLARDGFYYYIANSHLDALQPDGSVNATARPTRVLKVKP